MEEVSLEKLQQLNSHSLAVDSSPPPPPIYTAPPSGTLDLCDGAFHV